MLLEFGEFYLAKSLHFFLSFITPVEISVDGTSTILRVTVRIDGGD